MKKEFGVKPYLFPMPTYMIGTYNEDESVDVMMMAWGGICAEDMVALNLEEDHKTVANILARGAFTVSMADAAHVAECDYVGIESANKVPDKLAKAGFHTEKAEFVDAPVILELPMAVECRLVSYDKESCRLVGEIVNVSADEKILDENGKIDPAKLEPIVFDPVNNAYLKLGEKVGNAFKDGMKLK